MAASATSAKALPVFLATAKRLLENLPKKLYYSDSQPSSYDWNDHIIIKL